MQEQSDWELIQEFNSERADHTFQTLVNRYLNLVYSAALRQVRDPQMAEDVSQAVFVILIKRSPQFSPKTVLAGWLFRTTRFVAAKAIRTEQRRRLRESLAIVMNEQPNESEDSFWQEIEPFLDEAIAQLPEVERNAVLERFFNGKSFKLVAEGLGTTEEAARKRVNRALEKLRDFFAHKKVGISALMLVGLLNERVLVAAPSALKASIGKDFGASISSSVRKLVEDSINIPGAARPPVLVAGAACIFLILVIGIWQNKQHSDSPRINPNLSVGITQTGSVRAASSRKSSSEKPRNVLPLRVLSAINNDPLEAHLRINYWLYSGFAAETVITNPKGEAALRLSGRDFEKLHVWVSAKGYVPKLVRWSDSELRGLIEEYVIYLNRGRAVAGTVVDEFGKPIPLVRIDPAYVRMNMAERENVGFHPLLARVSSDLDGRWRFDQLPEGLPSFSFHFSHPDFARKTAEMAAQQTNHLTILGKGIQFLGLVSSTNGEPMDGVKVEERPSNGAPEDSTVSDNHGKFAFNHLNQGDTTLTLTAKGYQTLTRMIQLVSNAHSEQFIMLPDSNSEVSPSTSRFVQVTVTAVDALTDEPLKSFKVCQVEDSRLTDFIGEGRAGKLQWRQRSWKKEKFVVEVQAEGYMPERTEPAVLDGENYSFQVKLRPDSGTRGIVLKPNGEPAIGAQVHLSGKNFHPVMALNGILQSGSSDGSLETTTDKRGGFYFRARIGAERVVVIHPDGCANALLTSLPDKPIILIPGGKIEGQSLGAGPGLMIGILPVPSNSKIPYSVNVKPDEEGKFTFERVPPGFYRVFRVTNLNGEGGGPVGYSHPVLVEVKSEATTQIMIGGKGRSIVGKLEVENFLPHWPRDLQRLTSLTSNGLPPKMENFSNPSDFHDAWAAYDASIPKYFFGVTAAGTFKIDDVAPGKYKLQISFTDTPEDISNPLLPHSKTIVLLTKEFEVPENSESSPIDLGVLPVPVR